MTPQKKNVLIYAVLTILSAWIALALFAAAGRAMSAGYPVSAMIIAVVGTGILSLGLLKMLPSYCQSLTTESVLQAGLRHAEEIARAMEGAKEAAPAEVPAPDQPMKMPPLGSAPVAQFDADTYFQATWRDADLSHDNFQRSIDAAAKDLWCFPLILLRDQARGRLVAMRNTKVPWVNRLSWEKMERELTIAEILARVGRWVESWQDFIGGGKANSVAFEKAMVAQNKEPIFTWLDNYLRDHERPVTLDNTPDGQSDGEFADRSTLELLCGELDEREVGRERLAMVLLAQKPACIPLRAVADALPRGILWKDSALLERFVLRLPVPGWAGVIRGTVGMMYDDSDPQAGNGSLLRDAEIALIVTTLVHEATAGVSEAAADIRQAVMSKDSYL